MRRILIVLTGFAVVWIAEESRLSSQAPASASLTVSANVVKNCAISTTPVNFGNYDSVAANATTPLDGIGTLRVACTRGAITHISLSYGSSPVGTQRRMAQNAASHLIYEIYKDTGRTLVWGNSVNDNLDPPPAPNNLPRTFTAYGRVPQAQDANVGSYTDTLVATVLF
jgi:spore coat protein U-like protein